MLQTHDLDVVPDPVWHPNDTILICDLRSAMEKSQTEVAGYLLQKGAPMDIFAIHKAVRCKSTAMFELLLEQGWDINSNVGHGSTALM